VKTASRRSGLEETNLVVELPIYTETLFAAPRFGVSAAPYPVSVLPSSVPSAPAEYAC
jgi:hypothetical protein